MTTEEAIKEIQSEINFAKEHYNEGIVRFLKLAMDALEKQQPAPTPDADPVNHPSHYKIGGIETIDIIHTMLTPVEFRGYLKGNILKYRERANYKGNPEQDYAKAKWYMETLMEVEE